MCNQQHSGHGKLQVKGPGHKQFTQARPLTVSHGIPSHPADDANCIADPVPDANGLAVHTVR